ncbi:MAG: ATP-binding protein [Candidatus Hermodarchaeota archaeon]
MLKEIFTPEEAELMAHFKAPFMDMVPPQEIADRSGKPFDEVVEILNSLANKGLMLRMGTKKRGKYSIWPFIVGIFEFYFSNAKIYSDEQNKKVAKLFEKYYKRFYWQNAAASNYPFPRVIPSKTSGKMIEINEVIDGVSQKVLPFEELEELLNQYASFAVMPCSCRTKAGYLEKKCDKPIETCMTFDLGADFFVKIGMAKRLSKEEALALLKKCEKAGMVHMTLNAKKPDFICNCCSDCCGILRPLTEFHQPGMFAISNFKPIIDEKIDCTECFICVDKCPTHAVIPWNENDKWTIEIDDKLCIGCGICSSNCPTKRIFLKKIKNETPEDTMQDAYMRYGKERYKNIMS